jgi:hypothetical protein
LTSIVILDAYFSGGPEQVFRNKKPEHWLLLGTDCPVDKPGKAFLSCYRSLLRHIGLAVSNLHWVHNIRGQLAALQVGSGDSMAIGHRGPQTSCQCVNWSHFWCHALFDDLNPAGEVARQGVRNTVLSCLVPVRSDFILAHSPLWNDPHPNLTLLICVVMQGSHWIS